MESIQAYNFTQWRQIVASSFHNVRAAAPAPNFRATAHHKHVGDIELFDMITDPHTVIHTEGDGSFPLSTMCKFSLQLEGVATLVQDGRSCTMHPGDLALYTGKRPYHLVFDEPQRSLVVYFPRSLLQLRDDQIDMITATPISREEGLGKLIIPLFEQFARNLDDLQGLHAQSLIRASLDLLVTVFAEHTERMNGELEDSSQLFRRATSYIDENLHDLDLAPGTIADALYVSVRNLHAHFSSQGLTVSAYIRARRLNAIHADLGDPQMRDFTIQTISARHGLVDASYVSKAFRAEYGESPRTYRTRTLT
ncbi:hypothetical protein A583_14883 [Corynebacterium glutamicum Z188]|uniref:AraC family transcriptional regulator n=1 Tax=Corynebacterium glutamicum TaxID=1718 RepID=A0AB36IJK3_CORGT|nr:helix-turn-helix domain-containing protein [Corynebacterium glutamicum]AGN17612.1 hypothetical protein C624_00085 [Corynebacterium glutamicum SCgG1]AGN20635.1 hypothetical protein C629_00085 [Corynebacterium glutamicum SCgG2]EGV41222.1 hypothetical protein CgS9114_04435 [Corynebacterium glutamicum S9114]EPP39351.1 hypothetical protein A583_14883 [Corynebacterium glutamicum Z188]NII88941.1 AraC-like DNA-binding protein [Corynebacterium glutamicum]